MKTYSDRQEPHLRVQLMIYDAYPIIRQQLTANYAYRALSNAGRFKITTNASYDVDSIRHTCK